MPAAFEHCVAAGGRVRTKTLGSGQYIRICYAGGKSYAGETHRRQSTGPKPRVHKRTRR